MVRVPHHEYAIPHGDCLDVSVRYLTAEGESAIPAGAVGLLAADWEGGAYEADAVTVDAATGLITHTVPSTVTRDWPVGRAKVRVQLALEADDCRTTILAAVVHIETSALELAAAPTG